MLLLQPRVLALQPAVRLIQALQLVRQLRAAPLLLPVLRGDALQALSSLRSGEGEAAS